MGDCYLQQLRAEVAERADVDEGETRHHSVLSRMEVGRKSRS